MDSSASDEVGAHARSSRSHILHVDKQATQSDDTYDDNMSVYTSSVTSSVLAYRNENGRTYHAYREGRYLLPNDDRENERLDIFHAMMKVVLDDELFLAPIGNSPKRVLDVGTGSGIWAIDFADEFPDCEVIGNDLSPTQPSMVPPNLQFLVDDVEAKWVYEDEPFDFIHARYLASAIRDMPRLIRQAYECTKPGGWVEFQDWDQTPYSTDGSTRGTSIEQLASVVMEAFEKAGYNVNPGRCLEGWFKEAGFINVRAKKILIPIGTWPKGKKNKKMGAYNALNSIEGADSLSLAILTRNEQWKVDEVRVLAAKAKNDIRRRDVHAQFDFYVVFGQKPVS